MMIEKKLNLTQQLAYAYMICVFMQLAEDAASDVKFDTSHGDWCKGLRWNLYSITREWGLNMRRRNTLHTDKTHKESFDLFTEKLGDIADDCLPAVEVFKANCKSLVAMHIPYTWQDMAANIAMTGIFSRFAGQTAKLVGDKKQYVFDKVFEEADRLMDKLPWYSQPPGFITGEAADSFIRYVSDVAAKHNRTN